MLQVSYIKDNTEDIIKRLAKRNFDAKPFVDNVLNATQRCY